MSLMLLFLWQKVEKKIQKFLGFESADRGDLTNKDSFNLSAITKVLVNIYNKFLLVTN